MLVMQLAPASPASAADDATLTQDVTPEDPPYDGNLSISSVSAFDPDGGTAVFEPGTDSEESFTYTSTDSETLILTGVRRESPVSHPKGSVVAPAQAASPESPEPDTPSATPSPTASDGMPSPSEGGGVDGTAGQPDMAGAQSSSAGMIPDPCEILQCETGDPCTEGKACDAVDAIVAAVESCTRTDTCNDPVSPVVAGLIYDLCGSDNVLACDDEVSRVIQQALGELCPYGVSTCADPTINFIANLVMGIVCPSGSLGFCAGEIISDVNEQVAFVAGVARGLIANVCGSDSSDACVNTVMALLDAWVFQTVCGSSNAFTCTNNLADTINDAVANLCTLNAGATAETTDSAVTNCVTLVLNTVQLVVRAAGDTMIVACGSDQATSCVSNIVERINVEINKICASLPGSSYSTGANECIDKTLQIVNAGVEAAKQQMRDRCGSDVVTTCANNVVNDLLVLVDRVNDMVANTCNSQIGAATSTTDSAVTNCVNRVLQTVIEIQALVNARLVEICGSSDPNACAANLIERINIEINRICASLPGSSYSTGANECIDKTLQIVNGGVEDLLAACPALDCLGAFFEVGDVVIATEHQACSRGECIPDCSDQQALCAQLDTTCASLPDCSPTPPICDAIYAVCTSEALDDVCSAATVLLCVGVPLTPDSLSQYKPDESDSGTSTASSGSSTGSSATTSSSSDEVDVQTPSHCKGKQDHVHESYHRPGTVSARARTFCRLRAVPWLYVYAQLWEKHWWGYDEVGDDNWDAKYWEKYVHENAYAGCDDHAFRLSSVHKVTEIDGEGYSRELIGNDFDKPCGDHW